VPENGEVTPGSNYSYPLFVRRVGLPDNAQRELAARNFGQHCSRTSWDRDLVPHRVLTPERVVRLAECLLEGDRSEYHNIAALRASRKDERSEQGRQRGWGATDGFARGAKEHNVVWG
jgi:hypothetical protein